MKRKFLIFTFLSFTSIAHAFPVENATISSEPSYASADFTINNWFAEYSVPANTTKDLSVPRHAQYYIEVYLKNAKLVTKNCRGWLSKGASALKITSNDVPITKKSIIFCSVE